MDKPYREKYKVDVPEGESGDWKVERFTMQPEEGPKKVHDILTCPRFTLDGKKSTTEEVDGDASGKNRIHTRTQPGGRMSNIFQLKRP